MISEVNRYVARVGRLVFGNGIGSECQISIARILVSMKTNEYQKVENLCVAGRTTLRLPDFEESPHALLSRPWLGTSIHRNVTKYDTQASRLFAL